MSIHFIKEFRVNKIDGLYMRYFKKLSYLKVTIMYFLTYIGIDNTFDMYLRLIIGSCFC